LPLPDPITRSGPSRATQRSTAGAPAGRRSPVRVIGRPAAPARVHQSSQGSGVSASGVERWKAAPAVSTPPLKPKRDPSGPVPAALRVEARQRAARRLRLEDAGCCISSCEQAVGSRCGEIVCWGPMRPTQCTRPLRARRGRVVGYCDPSAETWDAGARLKRSCAPQGHGLPLRHLGRRFPQPTRSMSRS
jgi:hypothetical protein